MVKMSFQTPSTMGDVAICFVGDTSASLIVFTCVYREELHAEMRTWGGRQFARRGAGREQALPSLCGETKTFWTRSSGEPTPFLGPDLQTSINSARVTAERRPQSEFSSQGNQ